PVRGARGVAAGPAPRGAPRNDWGRRPARRLLGGILLGSPRDRMRRIARMLLALVGAAACTTPQIGDGGTDRRPGGAGDDLGSADASPGDPIDDLPATADAAPEEGGGCYNGALRRRELVDAAGYTSGTAPDDYFGLEAAIDGVPVGVFYIDLYGGRASLTDGVLPGTYTIQGDDTVWSLCAVCAWATFGVSESKWVMA